MKAYNEILKLDPNEGEAWHGKGFILFVNRKFSDALNCIEKSLSINPSSEKALNLKNLILKEINLQDISGESAMKVSQTRKESFKTSNEVKAEELYLSGIDYARLRKFKKANKQYDKSIHLMKKFNIINKELFRKILFAKMIAVKALGQHSVALMIAKVLGELDGE